MNVNTERLPNCQVALTIQVDEERVQRALRKAARRIAKDVRIPGFRPGKAPYNVVVQRVGLEAIRGKALDDLAQEVYKEALQQLNLEPFDQARLEEVSWDPLTLRLVVPVAPEVDLGAYRELRLEPEPVTIPEEEVEAVLQRLREQNTQWVPVERPARFGDLVIIDVEGTMNGRTVLERKGQEVLLTEQGPEIAPGFNKHIVGMSVGGEKSFLLAVPMEGEKGGLEEVQFRVQILEIKEPILPDLDDDLALTVGNYDTLEDLRQAIRERLQKEAEQKAEAAFREQVFQAVMDGARIEFPDVLVEQELDKMLENLDHQLQQQGINLDTYLEMLKQSREEYRESLRPQAVEQVKRALVLSEVIRQEMLEVEKGEIEEEIKRISQPFGEQAASVRRAFSTPQAIASVGYDLLVQKAFQRLVDIAKGEAPPLPEEEPEEAAEEPLAAEEAGAPEEPEEAEEVEEPQSAEEPEEPQTPEASQKSEKTEEEAGTVEEATPAP